MTHPQANEKIRLSKLLAFQNRCSRREADVFIEKGWVRVDGKPVTTLGTKISPQQQIVLDPRAKRELDKSITILLNKPIGYVSSQPEKGYPAALSLILPQNHYAQDPTALTFRPSHLQGLAPAGRLDIDSQGLLVLTQDGYVARHLIGPESTIDKEYLVRFQGELTPRTLLLLNHGLSLDNQPLKPAQVARQNDNQLKFILREGRKRQIRRMCEQVGLKVMALKRVRIGEIRLGSLPLGRWRYLGKEEHF